MSVAVIGGDGFIGKNLVHALPHAHVIERGDRLNFAGRDAVVHLAANADVRGGWADPNKDFAYVEFTKRVLDQMRVDGVRKLVFASTGSVYRPKPTAQRESDPCQATSLYAASKAASEQWIAAYAAANHVQATVLRFVSVLGPHYSHGLVYDFVNKLRDTPDHLDVIAPGTSQKSYVHVSDVVRAIRLALEFIEPFEVFNVGTDETATPVDIAQWITDAEIRLVGNTWVGDNPHILLDCTRLRELGWMPEWSIRDAVKDTARWLTGVPLEGTLDAGFPR